MTRPTSNAYLNLFSADVGGVRGFFALLLIAWCASSVAETLSGTVVYVADGDTISVLAESGKLVRVRIAGIDAPERQQPYGAEAKSFLVKELSDKVVVLDVSKTDRYGRWLARVSHDGRDIGLGAIEAGLAWHYVKYAHEQAKDLREAYSAAESIARAKKLGIWGDLRPIPPWDWRHQVER